jgi:lysophospholipase L1-like esterase
VKLDRTLMFIAALGAAGTLATAAPAAETGPYVALGDSYTAAPLVPNLVGKPLGCARSDHDYPSLVARALGSSAFRDVSCSSATTVHMTRPQSVALGTNPPQLDALSASTELVTLGIGGNDVGLVGAAVTCAQLGALAPTGMACRSHFAPGGDDQVVAQIAAAAPRIAAVIEGIRERSPRARIVVVGYPDVLPRSGDGCYPLVPLSADDVRYFDGLIVQTNAMLAATSAANGAEFVDTYVDSVGHDVCTLPPVKWFEGVVVTAPAYPLHPNALGMASMSRSVLRVLGAPRPGPAMTRLARAARSIRVGRAARFSYRLDRAATVAIAVQRATAGRRSAGACRAPARSDRGAPSCRRYVAAGRTSAGGQAGENTLALGAKSYGRRPGLFRLTATPTSDGHAGATRTVQFRVKR